MLNKKRWRLLELVLRAGHGHGAVAFAEGDGDVVVWMARWTKIDRRDLFIYNVNN